jgi:hypothetical protein
MVVTSEAQATFTGSTMPTSWFLFWPASQQDAGPGRVAPIEYVFASNLMGNQSRFGISNRGLERYTSTTKADALN